MSKHSLNEQFQSAYRTNHGIETALIEGQDDILHSLDTKCGVVLVMLNLSAAFDTIDHTILLNRINSMLGVEGAALN